MTNKTVKIIINIFIFLMVAGFIIYMVKSVNHEETTWAEKEDEAPFVSHLEKVESFDINDTIKAFEIFDHRLFVLAGQSVKQFGVQGNTMHTFNIQPHARDIIVNNEEVYILYPTLIEVYDHQGDSIHSWEACSDLSDYCSFTQVGDDVYITDAGNKNICQYTKQGNFVRFIESPRGFVTPSHAFDITSINDTIYCVNPGRHMIETYTQNGDFIAAFGGSGIDGGFFAGCCNPSHISFNEQGNLLTSEKGNPRICSYNKSGDFNEVVLNSRLLGGGHLAYEVKESNNLLFAASVNQITIYQEKK